MGVARRSKLILKEVGYLALCGACLVLFACDVEIAEGEDGLVSSMFKSPGGGGSVKEEKETVVVVIDRTGSGGDEDEQEGMESGEALDLQNVNVVFVYRDDGGQVVERADFPEPEGADLRFSGEWVRRVHEEAYWLEVRIELRSDGKFEADVDGERFDEDRRERARITGEWDARGDDVIVQVHETSNPRLYPKGMIEVMGDGRVGEGMWTFLDSRGVRRTARRPRIENAPPSGGGGASGDA